MNYFFHLNLSSGRKWRTFDLEKQQLLSQLTLGGTSCARILFATFVKTRHKRQILMWMKLPDDGATRMILLLATARNWWTCTL